MQFIDGSHKEGFFDHVQSTKKGNVLNENQDMVIPEKWNDKIVQTKLLPGQCTFHDGKFKNYLSILPIWCCLKKYNFLGMLVHGSKASLNKRRIGLTAQFCQTSVKMVPMNYTKSIAFEEDFRKPVLISGRDVFGKLNYVKTKECLQRQAAI